MCIRCNADIVNVTRVVYLKGFDMVWYHMDGIANTILLDKAKGKLQVIYSSGKGNNLELYKADVTTRYFNQTPRGLFYFNPSINPQEETTLVNTVLYKNCRYTLCTQKKARVAHKLQLIIGCPYTRISIKYIHNNSITHCTFTITYIKATADIFVTDVVSIKGKMARYKTNPVEVHYTNVPRYIIGWYKEIILTADIMFIKKLSFFMTIIR